MVYTGRGDAGRTDLGDGQRVSKTDARIEAYGTVDELNAVLGRVRAETETDTDIAGLQQDLHTIQAALAMPDDPEAPTLADDAVAELEDTIDEYQAALPDRDRFVVAGDSAAGASFQHARAVCRRAERRVVALAEAEAVPDPIGAYLNRLSDLLFVCARRADDAAGVDPDAPAY
ncbi:cob(I)yrinic acid a,c-diamide adenosyltransferase [Halococcoides cellulosivorans]|uniref:Cob(I)yrinic acid a,c-diamide adenosyltransferase n=1 Tax=Halococcoides cellulosivorans TaxID=1679096 RepID=A0A2R4X002_9EURY|nr:cob(I)yrinic acid a,c-diamide adenosyltransferase [Halococcoides cellulosivorans]AWB27124.1 cob(I)yrinic acid a,c-diamide adenosyltransferase [Halococcoides cellulosivorans]